MFEGGMPHKDIFPDNDLHPQRNPLAEDIDGILLIFSL
jgi:hypothetical protein